MRTRRKMTEETNREELLKKEKEEPVDLKAFDVELMKRVEQLEKALEKYRSAETGSRKKTAEGPLNSMVSGRSGKVCSAGPANRSMVIKEG